MKIQIKSGKQRSGLDTLNKIQVNLQEKKTRTYLNRKSKKFRRHRLIFYLKLQFKCRSSICTLEVHLNLQLPKLFLV